MVNWPLIEPGAVERVINKGADNATRCIEIASGSPLTEEEKNATKKSEINPECPSIANPKYMSLLKHFRQFVRS